MDRLNLSATLLDEVTENTIGDKKIVELYSIHTFQIISADVSNGATVAIQASLDGTNWTTYETYAIVGNTSEMLTIAKEKLKYVRAVVSDYVDGTYTVLLVSGV